MMQRTLLSHQHEEISLQHLNKCNVKMCSFCDFSFLSHIWLPAEECSMLEIPCMSDYDIRVKINTCLQNKTWTTEVLTQHSSERNEKNRKHFWFTEQIGNFSRRKRKSFHANQKISLDSGPKITLQKQLKKCSP